MSTYDRFAHQDYDVIIARAHAERAAYFAKLLGGIPGAVRKLFHRSAAPKVGMTAAVATAYGVKA